MNNRDYDYNSNHKNVAIYKVQIKSICIKIYLYNIYHIFLNFIMIKVLNLIRGDECADKIIRDITSAISESTGLIGNKPLCK